MFKVGDKAKGFKFDGGTDGVHYVRKMVELVGVVGTVVAICKNSFNISFQNKGVWMYPASLWHLAKVGEDEPPKIGEEVPFKIGDRVKFTESSLASGMIDAKEDDVFTVQESYIRSVTLEELQGCYHVTHFEHVQEEVVDNTEEQEIKWEVGQEVFCLLRGKGVVVRTGDNDGAPYVVGVDFGYTFDNYTIDGKIYDDHRGRVLFFSEPKIEAEKFPPKKPFTPTLKKGDVVIVKWVDTTQVLILQEETELQVKGTCGQVWDKDPDVHFYKLGEEIIFN